MALLDLNIPSFKGLDISDEKAMRRLTSYLYKLDEQLRFVLSNLGEENLSDSLRAVINTSVDAQTINELTGQLQRLSTKIVQTAEAIALKASKEELDALGETLSESVAEFEATADAIRTEVSNTATGLQSQIDQQANQISLTVSTANNAATAAANAQATADGKLGREEAAKGVNTGSGIVINENGVYVEGKNIDLRTSEGDEYVHISEAGVSASSISAPNVMARYDGPASIWVNPAYTSAELDAAPGARFRSLKDALAALSNKYVPYGVSVTMAAGAAEYGDAALSGCIAANDIGIWGESASNRSKIYGKVTISRCAGEVSFGYLDVASSANTDGIYIDICSAAVSIFNCNFTGNGGGSAVSTNAAAHVLVSNVSMRHYSYAIYAYMTSTVYSSGNSGNCDIACDCSLVYGSGYQPSSTTTLSPAEIRGGMFRNGGCSVNQGSGGSSGAPTLTTKTYTATSTGSYKGSGSKYRNEVAQGWLSGTGCIRGCMWFDNASIRSAINGKTVMSASLRLSMRKGVGRGVAVTVELSGTYSNSGASSAAVTKSYGVLGTANPGETVTFTLPTAAVTDLVNGTINGLMLYSSDTGAYKERDYSKNYAVFDGAADGTPPVLTVIYQ